MIFRSVRQADQVDSLNYTIAKPALLHLFTIQAWLVKVYRMTGLPGATWSRVFSIYCKIAKNLKAIDCNEFAPWGAFSRRRNRILHFRPDRIRTGVSRSSMRLGGEMPRGGCVRR